MNYSIIIAKRRSDDLVIGKYETYLQAKIKFMELKKSIKCDVINKNEFAFHDKNGLLNFVTLNKIK